MTGFAAKTITLSSKTAQTNIAISLKSLNSRFFETTFKLHYQLNNLEIDLIKLLKEQLHRGHIYVTIFVGNQEFFQGLVEPSLNTIEGYNKAIETVKKKYAIQGSLTVSDLIRLPNAFIIPEQGIDEQSKNSIFQATKELIKELIAAQEKEGANLLLDIEKRINTMHAALETIEQTSMSLIDLQKEKIQNSLSELSLETQAIVDAQKHAAYVLLDKMDINEEIVRFKSHLKTLQSTLASADIEKGKRIDFTLQELAREINTIAAKCSDATIGRLAINVKVEIEKAREQAQNLV